MNELIYGIHAVESVFNYNPRMFVRIYIVNEYYFINNRLKFLIEKLEKICLVTKVSSLQFKYFCKKFGKVSHQGIVAEIRTLHQLYEYDLLDLLAKVIDPLILVLDCVTDPHNLGACLRCAVAAGVNVVIVPRDRSSKINATVRKVASGAVDMVPLIRVTNLVRTLELLKEHNIRIIGTIVQSNNYLYGNNFCGKLALVIGSESKGIRRLTMKTCDELISIPMIKNNVTSSFSLNVAVATGICLFEVVRQRNFV